MKIYVGADYRGFSRKQELLKFLVGMDAEVVDLGSYEAPQAEEDKNTDFNTATGVENEISACQSSEKNASCDPANDYNDFAIAVATAVREDDPAARGILICDSAHGMTIQANRYKGIRAANCETPGSAQLARKHEDANVLCLSAHFIDEARMREIVQAFLSTDFTPIERRVRRINRLDERSDYD